MANEPQSLNDVTADWLANALGSPIESIEVQPIAAGEGFMGQLARVTIESTDASVPNSVIVKLPTSDPGGQFIGEIMRVWEREHCFYRDVAPHMSIRVPIAYVNIAEPPCLVLEDLAPAPSPRPGQRKPNAPSTHSQRITPHGSSILYSPHSSGCPVSMTRRYSR